MSNTTHKVLVLQALLCALVFVRRRRNRAATFLLGFFVLQSAADLLTLWLAPGLHHTLSVWYDKHSN